MKTLVILAIIALTFNSCSSSTDLIEDTESENRNLEKIQQSQNTSTFEKTSAQVISETVLQEENRVLMSRDESIQLYLNQSPTTSLEARLVVQYDGNLVAYVRTFKNSTGLKVYPIWATDTNQPSNVNAFLVCQSDGNLVLYKYAYDYSASNALWSTNSGGGSFTNSYIKFITISVLYSDLSRRTFVKLQFFRNNTFYREIFSRDITSYYSDIS